MKIIAKIGSIYVPEVGHDLAEELFAVYPEGRHGPEGSESGYYDFFLPTDDPRLQRFLDTLKRHGVTPINVFEPRSPSPKYSLRLSRLYDQSDLDAADFLTPNPEPYFDAGRTAEGLLLLVIEDVRDGIETTADIAAAGGMGTAVSDRLRRRIEQEQFVGVQFRETALDEPLDEPLPTPYWELVSDIALPPLSKRNHLYNEVDQHFDGDYSKWWYVREGTQIPDALYFPPELHYDAADLEPVRPFDVAQTQERIGGGQERDLVVSQRFYQFCQAENLPVKWMPVRIDP